jgi:hypothetical protein
MTMNEQQPPTETPAGLPGPVESQALPPSAPVAAQEPSATVEAAASLQPPTGQEPSAEAAGPKQEPKAAQSRSTRQTAPQRRSRGSGQDPARVADYFTACPRCSFFLAGYRLIFQDFNEAAASSADDWLDLSWNLAVRNLLAKSYGYDLAEPFEAFQGVCPLCRRAFAVEASDDQEYRFSVQINPRT